MRLHLADISPDVVAALHRAFASFPDVEIALGDVLQLASGALVAPANSDGFMDGGLDAALVSHLGSDIQVAVREAIQGRPDHRLPVGASLVVPTQHDRIQHLIVVATMETPGPVEASNAYRAMRAMLRAVDTDPATLSEVWLSGLCTGVGEVAPEQAAAEMAEAYRDWLTASKP